MLKNNSDQKIPVFVISLERAPERRAAIQKHLDNLNIEYRMIDAIDGIKTTPSEISAVSSPEITVHPGVIGCYLSHIKVYEIIRDEGIEVALVLEDDARLDKRVKSLLENGCDSLDWDYCYLDCDDHNLLGPVFYDADSGQKLAPDFIAYSLSSGPQTLHAYLITGAASAKRLAHAYPIKLPIDLYDHLPYPISFYGFMRSKFAWVGEESLTSFTSEKGGIRNDLLFVFFRRWPLFYKFRDILRFKDIKSRRLVRTLQAEGKLSKEVRWKSLPSGRDILIT